MSKAIELAKLAGKFEEHASNTDDIATRQHYREMAAHYCALSVEHQEIAHLRKPMSADSGCARVSNSTILAFQTADRATYRRVVVVSLTLCIAFVAISFSLRPQEANDRILVKADRLVRSAGDPAKVR